MKQNRRPAPVNAVQGDTEGTTWALPEGAIARLGKGIALSSGGPKLALPPGGVYFAVQTRIGLWWYEMSSKSPIALWETERGMISAVDCSQDGEWIAIANYDGVIKLLTAFRKNILTALPSVVYDMQNRHYYRGKQIWRQILDSSD